MKNIFCFVFFLLFLGVMYFFYLGLFCAFLFVIFSVLNAFSCEQSVRVFVGILIFCTLFHFFC